MEMVCGGMDHVMEIGCPLYLFSIFIQLLLLPKLEICLNVPVLFQRLYMLFVK